MGSTNAATRAGRWQAYGAFQAMAVLNVVESNAGIVGGGIGVGYDFTEHFTLSGDLSLSSAQFEGGLLDFNEDHEDTTLFMAHLYADYNILKYPVTPVLSGGLGVGAFSNGTGAALDQTIGFGVRWDIDEHMFFKALVRTGVFETTDSHISDKGEAWACIGFFAVFGAKF